jgi:CRP/FNR family transcriptional regulator, cyclic AMP receptor protein
LLLRKEGIRSLDSRRHVPATGRPPLAKPLARNWAETEIERWWGLGGVPSPAEKAVVRLKHASERPDGVIAGHVDPLFLLACALRWKTQADIDTGWELVRAARSTNQETRALAHDLLEGAHEPLSRGEGGERESRAMDLQRFRNPENTSPASRSANRYVRLEASMHTPYGIEIVDDCRHCKLNRDGCFCDLSPEVLGRFNAIGHPSIFPGGALLFVEGQTPRGVYVLCGGKVKLSTTSRDGKVLILRIAGPGEVLGLSAVVSSTSYELTAQTAMPCQVKFVERDALIRFLAENGEAGLRSAQALSREFQSAYQDIHDLVLARSSAGKLARLLLSCTPLSENGAREIRIRSGLTHEEMAQMIGSSRETVTRLLSDLKKKELIRLEGSTLVIRNRIALEAIAS